MSFTAKEDSRGKSRTREDLKQLGNRVLSAFIEQEEQWGGRALEEDIEKYRKYDPVIYVTQMMVNYASEDVVNALHESPSSSLRAHVSDKSFLNEEGVPRNASEEEKDAHLLVHSPGMAVFQYIHARILEKFGADGEMPDGKPIETYRQRLEGKLLFIGMDDDDIDAVVKTANRVTNDVIGLYETQFAPPGNAKGGRGA